MKQNLERTFDFIGRWEGKKVHKVKGDRGGITSAYGMTLATLKTLRLDINKDGVVNERDVYLVTREIALNAFKRHFWNRIGGDTLPPGVDLILGDVAWNSNPSKALQFIREGYANRTVEELTERRRKFYRYQANNVPGQAKFLQGWLNRANNALKEARKIIEEA